MINQCEDKANAALTASGWASGNTVQVNLVETASPAQWFVVIEQEPKADTDYQKNGVIKVTVGQPRKITVPDFKGMTAEEAQAAAQKAGFAGSFSTSTVAVNSPIS